MSVEREIPVYPGPKVPFRIGGATGAGGGFQLFVVPGGTQLFVVEGIDVSRPGGGSTASFFSVGIAQAGDGVITWFIFQNTISAYTADYFPWRGRLAIQGGEGLAITNSADNWSIMAWGYSTPGGVSALIRHSP